MTVSPAAVPELPLTFRQELAPHLFKAVAGGWSCAVVGLPGFGLSNLLRFIAEPRVAAHYLGDEAGHSLLVYAEADRLLGSDLAYAGLARELLAAVHSRAWPRAEQAALRRLAETPEAGALAEPAAPLAGLVQHLCGDLERRVVFVCDEFDAALRNWPPGVLRELRALRDTYKYRLAFVAGVRRNPAWTAAQRADDPVGGAEKMAELFTQHTFPLRPYARDDAHLALARKTGGWPQPPSDEQLDRLVAITGGHAGLLIASLIYLEPRLHLPWANVERGLLAEPVLAEICRKVWQALEPSDRRALWLLARDERDALDAAALQRLELLGLAMGGPPFVFSSIVEAYVLAQPEPPEAAVPVSTLRDPAATVLW